MIKYVYEQFLQKYNEVKGVVPYKAGYAQDTLDKAPEIFDKICPQVLKQIKANKEFDVVISELAQDPNLTKQQQKEIIAISTAASLLCKIRYDLNNKSEQNAANIKERFINIVNNFLRDDNGAYPKANQQQLEAINLENEFYLKCAQKNTYNARANLFKDAAIVSLAGYGIVKGNRPVITSY